MRYKIQKINGMKKLVYTFIALGFTATSLMAQDAATKGVRFGIYGRATPTWYSMTTNNNYSKGGAVFGAGFGLNLEFRMSDVVSFQTGVAGDFDGGKIKYNNNLATATSYTNEIYTGYYLDRTPALVQIKGTSPTDSVYTKGSYTGHVLTSRQIHTTYVTIPVLLKMKTKEIAGFTYFMNFGGHIGVLAAATADDKTLDNITYVPQFTSTTGSYNGVSIYKDCIPVRVGLNLGAGAEYRVSGSTSVFASVNFVNSFISVVKAASVYNTTGTQVVNNNSAFVFAAQSLKSNGIQINIGLLF